MTTAEIAPPSGGVGWRHQTAPSPHPVGRRHWRHVRDVHLHMLASEPDAFDTPPQHFAGLSARQWRLWAASLAAGEREAAWAVTSRNHFGTGLPWVGFVLCTGVVDGDELIGEIGSLWVRPDHRGRGHAHRLLAVAHDWALDAGAGRMRLWVGRDNHRAGALYRSLGYEPTDTTRPTFGGRGETLYVLPAVCV